MNILVVHPQVCKESAQRLSKAVLGVSWNPNKEATPAGIRKGTVFFNSGLSEVPVFPFPRMTINQLAGVRVSTDKIKSYAAFKKAGIPTCEYVTSEKDIPKSWKFIVCRETVKGRNCEGTTITDRANLVHDCPLYTKFFEHDEEHRIVVFRDKVIGRYMKTNLKDGQYDLVLMLPQGYEEIDPVCINAAKAVGLDYAGVDVLYNSKTGKYIVLEINSGPLLTEEALEFFVSYFNRKD